MAQHWYVQGDLRTRVTGGEAVTIVQNRISSGQFETWFQEGKGRLLSFTTNGERAMLMFLNDADDPGEHLTDQFTNEGFSSGFRLANGQSDEYPDSMTAPLELALDALQHRIDTGKQGPVHTWVEDR